MRAIAELMRFPDRVESRGRARTLILAVLIFCVAALFRFAHQQDLAPLIARGAQDFAGITAIHKDTAAVIAKKGVVEALFPSSWTDRRDTSLIQYPPGYALLLSGVYALNGHNPVGVQIVQGVLDCLAVVLVFLIAMELFNTTVSVLAGFCAAVSHHLCYYSMLLLPDAIAPVLVLAGTYSIVLASGHLARKGRGYGNLALAGFLFGLACIFRSSAMLLWVFWAMAFLSLRREVADLAKRIAVLALCSCAVVAPFTIRNYIIYGELIPLTLGTGILLQEGIAEADPTTGLPAKDDETMEWEARLYGRDDYRRGLMSPDGIFRESERKKRAMEVIWARPFWYISVMAERLVLMTKYSAHAPLISRQHSGSPVDHFRPFLRAVQRIFKETLLVGIILGLLLAPKERWTYAVLLPVPLYYLLAHTVMHAEFRYALPAHYLLFIFYAVGIYLLALLPMRLRERLRSPHYSVGSEYFERMQPRQYDAYALEPERSRHSSEDRPSLEPAARVRTLRPGRVRKMVARIGIDDLTQQETLVEIEKLIRARGISMMTVVNASKIVLADRDEELRRIINTSEIVTADGMSVVWVSRLLGQNLRERVTGIDTFEKLLALAAERGFSVYLLGARPQVVRHLVERLTERFPKLKIAGSRDGYFSSGEEVVSDIRRTRPDILFVAMGSPRQEKWLAANIEQLQVPFSIGIGGSFDHVAGFQARAPLWMQRSGLEWLYRLVREPRRLWKRYLVDSPHFLYLAFKRRGE